MTKLIEKMFKRNKLALFRYELPVPEQIEQLGYFATVGGPFWYHFQPYLEAAGFKIVGRVGGGRYDAVYIARYPDAQVIARALLAMPEIHWRVAFFFYRLGFLATPEGKQRSYRLDWQWNPFKVLRERNAFLAQRSSRHSQR